MTEHDKEETPTDESDHQRSLMKTGTLATGALALGVGSVGSASAQDSTVLVYSYDYHMNVDFMVTNTLEKSTTVQLLQQPGGGTIPEISQPDDYNGYVVRYLFGGGGDQAQMTTFIFGENLSLSEGDMGQFMGDASLFSNTLNLLRTTIQSGGNGGGGTTSG